MQMNRLKTPVVSRLIMMFAMLVLSGCLAPPPSPGEAGALGTAPAPEPLAGGGRKRGPLPVAEALDELGPARTKIGQVCSDEEGDPEDPEAQEDMQVLAAADEAAPEDEGRTELEDQLVFQLPVVENDKVRHYIEYYTGRGQNGLRRVLERSGRYLPMMQEIFTGEGLPPELSYLALIESGFNPFAVSSASATGPWQFMEGTARLYDLKNDRWRDERRDPVKSTRAAARHLRDLHQRFNGNWPLAIAAYNAGSGRVENAVRSGGSDDFWVLSRGGHLPRETRNYLPKLYAVLHIVQDPARYGLDNLQYQPPLTFDTVQLPGGTNLAMVADFCDNDKDSIRYLNPELKRLAVPPDAGPYPLRIPFGQEQDFKLALARVPAGQLNGAQRHRIRPGDTPYKLARQYGIKVQDLLAVNRIDNPRSLKVGDELIVPADGARVASDARPVAGAAQATPTYQVRKGDTLWSIARRFQVKVQDLTAWNGLTRQSVLHPGTTIQLAAAQRDEAWQRIVYQVRPGDTLWAISQRFALDVHQILDWNQLDRNQVLQPGQKLTLLLPRDGRG